MDVLPARRLRRALIPALSLSLLLVACGGGGDAPPPQNSDPVSADTALTASSNSAIVPDDAHSATAELLAAVQAVVAASSQATASVNCAGGGTAVFQATGASAALLGNGQLDQGETYSVVFNNCRSASGSASISGSLNLAVTSVTADSITVDTSTNNVVVSRPFGHVVVNGSSTFTQTTTVAGNTTTITTRWVSPSFSVTRVHGARVASFSLTNVDVTRTVVFTAGVFTSVSYTGTATWSASLPNGSFSVTYTVQNATYDGNGTPTGGTWTIQLPNHRLQLTVAGNLATVTIDFNSDGTIDRTHVFAIGEFVAGAGG